MRQKLILIKIDINCPLTKNRQIKNHQKMVVFLFLCEIGAIQNSIALKPV